MDVSMDDPENSSELAHSTDKKAESTHLDLIVEGLLEASDPKETYADWSIIGHGGTAEVYKATRITDETSVVAIKKFRPQSSLEDVGNELRTLQRISAHNHINTYIEGYVWENSIYVVLEYCSGSCTDILQLFKEPLREQEIAAICLHCLKALDYIHGSCKIVHRDIKAGNLLVSADGKILLADFGISKLFDDNEKTNTFIGSPYWMAPEVILAMETGTYSYPIDIWALGITLIELAETKPPHFELHGMSACYRIASGDPPSLSASNWTSNFHDFLRHCLQVKPDDRWTAKQLLKHDFVASVTEIDSKATIRDLVVRSKAAVKAVDFSTLTDTGLIVNIPPKLVEEEDGTTRVGNSDQEQDMSGGDISQELVQNRSMEPNDDQSKSTTVPTIDENSEDELPTGFSEIDDQPMKETGGGSDSSITKIEDTTSNVESSRARSEAVISIKSLKAIDTVTTPGVTPDASFISSTSPVMRSRPKSRRTERVKSPVARPESLKLPGQLEQERNRALASGGMLLKAQMRAITKLRGKHTEEIHQLQEKLKQEQSTVLKAQDNQEQNMKRSHTASLKEFTKETEQENSKLTKQQATTRKKVEEALRFAWNQHKKQLQVALKQHLSELKKTHKALKESKLQIVDVLDSARERRNKEIQEIEQRMYQLEKTLLQSVHTIETNQHQLQRLKLEFEMREKQLDELVTLEANNKTGQICVLQRQHIEKVHQKQLMQQQERQSLIMAHYRDNFQSELHGLEKQHTVEAKQLKSTLKKLPVMDQEVVRIFQRRASENSMSSKRSKANAKTLPLSMTEQVNVNKIPKESLRGLKSAKEEHTKNLTMKLNEEQVQIMELKRREKEAEAEHLEALHKAERQSLERAQQKQLNSFDERIQKVKNNTTQYVQMQKKNFVALRKDKMKKPMKRANSTMQSHQSVLRSTAKDLIEFYTAENRTRLRPIILNDLSFDLSKLSDSGALSAGVEIEVASVNNINENN